MNPRRVAILCVAGLPGLLVALVGCTLEPPGTNQERATLVKAGQVYETPFEKRTMPVLPAQPDWRDVLQRAFYANGDLEAAYFEWKAAMARVAGASAWPNSNVQFGFDYMFSKEKMKAWDRTTLSVGFDPSMPLQWPTKVEQAGQVALDEALVARGKFETTKFALQQKVLTSYLDYALAAEKARIQTQNLELLQMLVDTAAQRVRTGAPQQDLLKAQTELEMARNELARMKAELNAMRAMLNGMLARPADAPLDPPAALPAPRRLAADDARLIAVATDRNPELARLAREVQGRADALELARLAYIPDFSPQFSLTGNVSQAVGTMVMLPTNLARIRSALEEGKALLRATEAMARQARAERGASFVAALYALRNSEREAAVFQQSILPRAEQVLASSAGAYSTGMMGFADLIDSQRTVLEVRLLVAEARIAREKRLAEMEALAGVDIETLGAPSTRPATLPPPDVPASATQPVTSRPAG